MSQPRIDKLAILLRVLGLGALVFGLILTKDRAGDWFFRSETFSERYAPALAALRILLVGAGLGFLVLGGRVARAAKTLWDPLSPQAKISAVVLSLFAFCFILFYFTIWAKENAIYLGEAAPFRPKYKIFGFEAIMSTNEFRTADFISCIFFAMSFSLSFLMATMHRFGILRDREERGRATMWLLFGAGFFFLVLDEFYGIHEFIGNNFLSKNTLTHNPDDAIIILYFLIAMAIIFRFRRYFLANKAGLVCFAIGASFHAVGVLIDAFFNSYFWEEGSEAMAGVFYFGALLQYAVGEFLTGREAREKTAG